MGSQPLDPYAPAPRPLYLFPSFLLMTAAIHMGQYPGPDKENMVFCHALHGQQRPECRCHEDQGRIPPCGSLGGEHRSHLLRQPHSALFLERKGRSLRDDQSSVGFGVHDMLAPSQIFTSAICCGVQNLYKITRPRLRQTLLLGTSYTGCHETEEKVYVAGPTVLHLSSE